MSTASRMRSGLYWKEARQLVPLVAMLIGVGLFVLTIWSVTGATNQGFTWGGKYLVLAFPGLFAAGVGAILVGQEKENRTLDWNVSLPIPAYEIIAGKFFIGFAGLLCLWSASLALLVIAPFQFSNSSPDALRSTHIIVWFTYSLYLLAAGFYTAWRFQNAFASLIALVPIAAIPFTIELFVSELRLISTGRSHLLDNEMFVPSLTITSSMLIVMIGLAVRAATVALSPAAAPKAARLVASTHQVAIPETNSVALPAPFRLPLTALVWQSSHHLRAVLYILLLLVVIGFLAYIKMLQSTPNYMPAPTWVMIAVTAGLFSISWLGVFAFAGDGTSKRMRFLADRGVSPTVAWLARHAVVASVLASLLVLYGLYTLSEQGVSAQMNPMPSMATAAIVLGIVYGVSQWTSQVIRILAASFIIAPVFSALAIYWLGFCAIELDAPLAWLLLCSTIPLVTTWWMMRSHMDDRGALRMWAAGGLSMTLLVMLPVLPAAIDISTWPRASSNAIAALHTESAQLRPVMPSEQMMRKEVASFASPSAPTEPMTQDEVKRWIASISLAPRDILQIAIEKTDETRPLTVDTSILEFSLQTATLAIYGLTKSSSDSEAMELADDWVDALTVICKRLRQSDRWIDQEAADAIEIWLIQALSQEPLATLREQESFVETVAMLSDSTARNRSRRRAVLASWQMYKNKVGTDELGTTPLGGFVSSDWMHYSMSPAKRTFLEEIVIDRVVVTAIEMIDANATGQPTEPMRRAMHEMVLGPGSQFESGPYANRLRVDDVTKAYSVSQTIQYPANQWFAGWEEIAKQWSVKK